MGGDFAPQNVVEGSLDALRSTSNRFQIVFVGQEDRIRAELDRHDTRGLAFDVIHASEIIGMEDSPTAALKVKRDSSIGVGMTAQREGKVDAVVSAGNTGAVMSAATLILGRLEGAGRPTIGAFMPTEKGVCLLLDAGANVDCRAQHLLEFAIMGSIYASYVMKLERPKVGLLSVGEESAKGNEVTQEANELLAASELNFIGNVEGRDILKGKAQVVVCDGFVGNIVLKFAESVLDLLRAKFREYAAKDILRKIWTGLMYRTLKRVLRDLDYQEHGGLPLLGVNGITIIGHGGSTAKAIKNMILEAEAFARMDVNSHIKQALAAHSMGFR
jgi:glycerol-3-phosphate acyltransferase PlsX